MSARAVRCQLAVTVQQVSQTKEDGDLWRCFDGTKNNVKKRTTSLMKKSKKIIITHRLATKYQLGKKIQNNTQAFCQCSTKSLRLKIHPKNADLQLGSNGLRKFDETNVVDCCPQVHKRSQTSEVNALGLATSGKNATQNIRRLATRLQYVQKIKKKTF